MLLLRQGINDIEQLRKNRPFTGYPDGLRQSDYQNKKMVPAPAGQK
jgi:hypothetical protein